MTSSERSNGEKVIAAIFVAIYFLLSFGFVVYCYPPHSKAILTSDLSLKCPIMNLMPQKEFQELFQNYTKNKLQDLKIDYYIVWSAFTDSRIEKENNTFAMEYKRRKLCYYTPEEKVTEAYISYLKNIIEDQDAKIINYQNTIEKMNRELGAMRDSNRDFALTCAKELFEARTKLNMC